MIQFADEALIEVRSGKGGNGCIAFRREKYVPNGGPNGGDGGKGGDVIFHVKRNLRTLAHMRYKQVFKARNGSDGEGSNRYGRNGDDVIIPVPPGTTIFDAETGELIREFTTESEDEQFVFLIGGKGGWGNSHFKTSTNQAPRYAHEGKPGEVRKLRVELSVMADVGLVGFPNAGKSSLLDLFTNARPKIAPYPFTTKIPNLGVLHASSERDIIIADIPGIIEGASEGAGLGIRFLKHISRTAGLLFMIDCSDDDCFTAYETLQGELESFSDKLAEKPRLILCNKIDTEGGRERAALVAEAIHKKDPNQVVIPMSVYTKQGLDSVRKEILDLVIKMEEQGHVSPSSKRVEPGTGLSDFMKSRSFCDDEPVQYPGSEG
ncbi:MAG: GTPase ObgE [Spirochaetaceae bacterium]|nr:GTPase ObgE [Spirochaetaceae bacterium]